jgi:hypothetical protein
VSCSVSRCCFYLLIYLFIICWPNSKVFMPFFISLKVTYVLCGNASESQFSFHRGKAMSVKCHVFFASSFLQFSTTYSMYPFRSIPLYHHVMIVHPTSYRCAFDYYYYCHELNLIYIQFLFSQFFFNIVIWIGIWKEKTTTRWGKFVPCDLSTQAIEQVRHSKQ